MSWLHLVNDKMYDLSDKPTSRTTLSRCRLLVKYKPCLGMQKEADSSDSSAKGIQLQHPSFRCIQLFWSSQTSVRSEVIISAHCRSEREIYCQDVEFWSLLMQVFSNIANLCALWNSIITNISRPSSRSTSFTVITSFRKDFTSHEFNSIHSSTKVVKLPVDVETLTVTIRTPKAYLSRTTDLGS